MDKEKHEWKRKDNDGVKYSNKLRPTEQYSKENVGADEVEWCAHFDQLPLDLLGTLNNDIE